MKSRVNCKRCKEREICITPCPALLNELVKVTGRRKELSIGTPIYNLRDWPSIESMKHLSKMERAVTTLELFKFPRATIAELFGITRESLRQHLYHARKKLLRSTE